MIYDCKNPITDIVSVERMKWKGGKFNIAPRNYSALAFRINGTATITVGGKRFFVKENDVLYLPQGIAYIAEYSDTEILVIHFKTRRNDPIPEVYSLTNTEEVYKSFLSANVLWQKRKSGYEAYVLSQIYYIFGNLCETNLQTQIPNVFMQAVSYINANYIDSTLSVEKVCKNVGMGATRLRAFFKKYYNKTPTEYITQLRLEYARMLIACGEAVTQAAEKSGFNDPKYFARVVKKHFCCTPRELKTYGK